MPVEDRGYTGGRHFIIVEAKDTSDRSRQITFLLPNGSRRSVQIDQSLDTPELREKIGESLYSGERIYGH